MSQDSSILSRVHPFASLPRDLLEEAQTVSGPRHLLAGEVVAINGDGGQQAYVVCSGAIQLSCDSALVDTLVAGDLLGHEAFFPSPPAGLLATATQDSVLIALKGQLFQLLLGNGEFEAHVRAKADSLRKRVHEIRQLQRSTRIDPFLRLSLRDVDHQPPLIVPPESSVFAAAGEMMRARATSCLVVPEKGPAGIITERDILGKVVAKGLDPKGTNVGSIMSSPVITVRSEDMLFEAFLRMVRASIRKLVVVDADGRPVGIIQERDLLSVKGENPVHLSGEIATAGSLQALKSVFERVDRMAVRSVAEGVGIFNVGRLISDMHDQILIRAVGMALEETGEPPPVAFSFLALGSEGRREQYLATDQDNALICGDSDDPTVEPFFERFAGAVSHALLSIGIPPCPHGVMVSNPDWRMPLGRWLDGIDEMIRKADLDSILRISLLTDMRHITGSGELSGRLKAYLFKKVAKSLFLLKYMAREALRFTPPIGFFGNFLVERGGERKGEFDIKKGGVFPITQSVRTLAVEHAILEPSTEERIQRLGEAGVFSAGLSAGILEAYAFFQTLRVRSQAERIQDGQRPDNHVSPDKLSSMERDRLKECFKIVVELQSLVHNKYGLRLLT
jgi:CBS domain-containing protein